MEKLNMNVTLMVSLASLLKQKVNLQDEISDSIRTTNNFYMEDFDNYVSANEKIPENKKKAFLDYLAEVENFTHVIDWNVDSVHIDLDWYNKMGGEGENVVFELPVTVDMERLYDLFLKGKMPTQFIEDGEKFKNN